MKIENKNPFSAILIIAIAIMFASCSKSTTSLTSSKLEYSQSLTNNHPTVPEKGTVAEAPVSSTATSCTETVETTPSQTIQGKEDMKQAPAPKKAKHAFAHINAKRTIQQLAAKTGSIGFPGTSNHQASYSGTTHTTSFLGLAVTCLIIGIILFFLGFGALGSLFWAIGIVLLVIAVVFFILWLLGQAIAD